MDSARQRGITAVVYNYLFFLSRHKENDTRTTSFQIQAIISKLDEAVDARMEKWKRMLLQAEIESKDEEERQTKVTTIAMIIPPAPGFLKLVP